MADKVRVGVVGTSWWADLHHLPSVKSHPEADLAAVCGRNRDRAEKIAGKYGIPRVYTDFREMIEKGGLQALIVAVPDDLHYEVTMAALEAGLHVICEKPLARNAAQAEEMYRKAEEAGVKHMTYFTWRWLPHYRYVKRLISEGFVGRPFHCYFHFLQGLGLGRNYLWRFDRDRGSGALGDLGSHMIDFAHWFVGDVSAVSADLATYVEREAPEGGRPNAANDSAVLTLEFESGAQGVIHVSAVAHLGARMWDQRMLLHGEEGSIDVTFTAGGAGVLGIRDGEREFRPLDVPDAYWEGAKKGEPYSVFSCQSVGVRLFIDSILEDRPVTPDFDAGVKVQKVLDAAEASHERGVRVAIR